MDTDFGPKKRPAGSLRNPASKPKAVDTQTPPASSDFKTPEEVAAADDLIEQIDLSDLSSKDSTTRSPAKGGRLHDILAKLHINWPFGKREWLVAAGILLLCVWGIGYALTHGSTGPVNSTILKHKKDARVPSTLTGLPVDADVNKRPVTGVMIENSLDARPQSGLGDAGVVFEAIAEGGITRFLALFQDTSPKNVGPIRSARPYYVNWALGFDAGYAHVGGSPEALANIRSWHVRDLDQFANAGAYHRVSSRAAPHNVYTSLKALNQLEKAKGYKHSDYNGFDRLSYTKAWHKRAQNIRRQPKAKLAKSIDFALSGPLFNVRYSYDSAHNYYKRSEGGDPHIDANTHKQIRPTVVIGLVMQYGLASDGHHSEYKTIGSGKAYIFQDGTVTIGRWSKKDKNHQLTFKDRKGHVILLEPGKTWLTALGDSGQISYRSK
jgi:hypothetical protein